MPGSSSKRIDDGEETKPSELNFFRNMVDELVEFSQYDPELADGLKWIDKEAQKRGIDFYEMTFIVLNRHDIDALAKEWLAHR